ncbi:MULTISPECIES: hypothetical protein [Helcococcus]|uniref:Uncharacterized protein n=2 Tax=Helcococcus bovis TaxID=3153252 RepID=A0ABW9F754_9FIRM
MISENFNNKDLFYEAVAKKILENKKSMEMYFEQMSDEKSDFKTTSIAGCKILKLNGFNEGVEWVIEKFSDFFDGEQND